MDLPDTPTLTRIAESLTASLFPPGKSRISAITSISTTAHPCFNNVTVIDFQAQRDSIAGEVIPISILMKKCSGDSIEFQLYSKLFEDLQPSSNLKRIGGGFDTSLNFKSGNLYSLTPRPLLTQKPYIFLENLESSESAANGGFKSMEFLKNGHVNPLELDFAHCLLAVETLARFHATSYMYRQLLGVKGKGKLELLQKYPFLNQSSPGSPFSPAKSPKLTPIFEQCFELALVIIEKENPSLAFKLRRKVLNSAGVFEKCVKLLQDEKYENDDFYVVCHGDFLPQNLLFSYDGETNGPKECRMVNFNSYFGPLGADLALFMLTSTSYNFRLEFEEKLLAHYCDAFQEQISNIAGHLSHAHANEVAQQFGDNIDNFHTNLERQYRKMLEFGFFNACVILPLIRFKYLCKQNNNIESHDDVFKYTSLGEFIEDENASVEFKNSDFETFAMNDEFLKDRLIDILKQLQKCRVLL